MTEKNIARFLYLVMAVGIALFIAKIYFYTIQGDDPWFAEQAYWLAKDGVVRSEFFSSVLNHGMQQFAYHKLHIWIAALAIKLFGLSFLTLKFITLSFFILLLWVSRKYFYTYFGEQAKAVFMVYLAFILINSLMQELVFVYRPEMAMTCLGLISYLFLRRSLAGREKNAVLAGAFAGLCALLHLNGLIFIAAGGVLLLANRRIKLAVWFGIAAMLVSAIYFIDILPSHWAEFWTQFRHDPAIPNSQFSISTLVGRILFEYDRFFGHGYESGYSLLLLVVIITNYKTIWQQYELRNSLLYFLGLSVVLAAISPGKSHYALLFGMPYAGIMIAASLRQALAGIGQNGKRRTLIGIAVLYVLANVPHALAIINDGRADVVTPQKNVAVMAKYGIQAGDTVYAPLEFIFNGLEKVHILGVDAYFMRARRGWVTPSISGFFDEANNHNASFVLLRRRQLHALKLKPKAAEIIDSYKYLGSMHGYYVYRRLSSKH